VARAGFGDGRLLKSDNKVWSSSESSASVRL